MEASSSTAATVQPDIPRPEDGAAGITVKPSELVEYTVAMRVKTDTGAVLWDDIATVTVPKRSQTRTVLLTGLTQAGISAQEALENGYRFRVLDSDTAKGHGLRVKEPREPEIELA